MKITLYRKVFRINAKDVVLFDPYNEYRKYFIAGERIKAGSFVYIGADGKAYNTLNTPLMIARKKAE